MTTTETEVKEETSPEEEAFDPSKVEEIIESLPQKSRRHLIPVLQRVQGAYRYLPEEALDILIEDIARSCASILYFTSNELEALLHSESFILIHTISSICLNNKKNPDIEVYQYLLKANRNGNLI